MFRTINKRIQYPEVKMNNIAIERVSKIKFLGIWLDEYLNWNHHMCVGGTKGTYRRDIKMIVNHDYINFDWGSRFSRKGRYQNLS